MTAAVLTKVAPARSSARLLADVRALTRPNGQRNPALMRLEAALGRDFADRLVAELSRPER